MNDVIVIGGGPAGSTSASYLTKNGRQVLLLEKERFPRDHVGESLLPFCYNLFVELGLLEQMKGSFVRKPGVRFIDKDGVASTTWCFDHVIKDPSYLSFQVVRSKFDQMLLNNTRRLGVNAVEETRVYGVDLERPDGLVEVKAVGPDGEQQTHLARFLSKKVRPLPETCNKALEVFARYHLSHAVGLLDALIGQLAVTLSLPLYTFNQKHYSAIPNLVTIQPYGKI